jgi:hypothetical protein
VKHDSIDVRIRFREEGTLLEERERHVIEPEEDNCAVIGGAIAHCLHKVPRMMLCLAQAVKDAHDINAESGLNNECDTEFVKAAQKYVDWYYNYDNGKENK